MQLDEDANLYIAGYSKSDGSTAGNDYVTLKLNNSGTLQWVQRYNGPAGTIDNAYDLVLDNSNNVYVTGQSYYFGDDYLTIKYSQPATATCSAPSGLSVTGITSTTAKIVWSAEEGAISYLVQYRKTGAVNWKMKPSVTTSKKIKGLSPATNYQYRVASLCSSDTSEYSPFQTFNTLVMRQGEFPADNKDITVYPNPVSTILNIDGDGMPHWKYSTFLEN